MYNFLNFISFRSKCLRKEDVIFWFQWWCLRRDFVSILSIDVGLYPIVVQYIISFPHSCVSFKIITF